MLADVARHIGDVVAAVAAPTRAAARAAAQAVEVEYEELPAVFDPLEALDAPPIHEQSVSAGEAVSIEVRPIEGTNVCHRFRIRHGDVAEGFARGRRRGRGDLPRRRRRPRADGAARRASPSGRTAA